jgi:hypothetical protein
MAVTDQTLLISHPIAVVEVKAADEAAEKALIKAAIQQFYAFSPSEPILAGHLLVTIPTLPWRKP